MTVLQDFSLSFSPAFIFRFSNQTAFPSLILLSKSFAHGIEYSAACCHVFFIMYLNEMIIIYLHDFIFDFKVPKKGLMIQY